MSDSTRRVAFVTGSTSGIGLAIAHRLASSGHDVIIHGLCPQNVIDAALAELRRQVIVSLTRILMLKLTKCMFTCLIGIRIVIADEIKSS